MSRKEDRLDQWLNRAAQGKKNETVTETQAGATTPKKTGTPPMQTTPAAQTQPVKQQTVGQPSNGDRLSSWLDKAKKTSPVTGRSTASPGVTGKAVTPTAPTYQERQQTSSFPQKKSEGAKADKPIGQYGRGNIDLYARPQYRYDDGRIATVESASFNIDGKEVLLPTIAFGEDGKAVKLTNQQAVERYRQTGEHLGIFDSPEEATEYAKRLHQEQEAYYAPKTAGKDVTPTAITYQERRQVQEADKARLAEKEAQENKPKRGEPGYDAYIRRKNQARDKTAEDLKVGLDSAGVRLTARARELSDIIERFGGRQAEDGSVQFDTQEGMNAYNTKLKDVQGAKTAFESARERALSVTPESAAALKDRFEKLKQEVTQARNEKALNLHMAKKLASEGAGEEAQAPYIQRVRELNDVIEELAAQKSEIGSRYYYAENSETLERLSKDQEGQRKYAGAEETREDLRKIGLVMGDAMTHGEDPALMAEYKDYLQKKYGLDQAAIDRYSAVGTNASGERRADGGYENIYDLQQELEARLKEQADELDASGYRYGRLSKYQARMAHRAEVEKNAERIAREVEDGNWLSNALQSGATVVAAPFQGIDLFKMWMSGSGDEDDLENYIPMDPYEAELTTAINAARGGVSQKLAEKYPLEIWGQNVASFLYQTGMSGLDSVVQAATLGKASVAFMGMNAAAATTQEVAENGGSNSQAFWSGLAAGAAEVVFEYVSVDRLLKEKEIKGVKALVKESLKQGGVEASEEVFTEIANILSNTVIMGNRSDFHQAVEKYKAEGKSDQEAKQQAFYDMIARVGWAGAGGALSGMGSSFVYNTRYYVNKKRFDEAQVGAWVRENFKSKSPEADLIQSALEMGEDTRAGKLARAMQMTMESKGSLTDQELGRLYNAIAEQANSAQTAREVVEQYAETSSVLGEQGREVIASLYEDGQDGTAYVEAMREVYDAAREGKSRADISPEVARVLSNEQVEAAYVAGREDGQARATMAAEDQGTRQENSQALGNLEQEADDIPFTVGDRADAARGTEQKGALENGQIGVRDDGVGQWADGAGADRPGGSLAEGAGRDTARAGRAGPADPGAAALKVGPAVSTRELGIQGGVQTDSVHMVTGGESAALQAAKVRAAERGLKLVAFTGGNLHVQRVGPGGKMVTVEARAHINGNQVYVRADHPLFTAAQLYMHEEYHDMEARREVRTEEVMEQVREQLGEADTAELEDVYSRALNGLEGVDLWKEIAADAYAGMNAFAGNEKGDLIFKGQAAAVSSTYEQLASKSQTAEATERTSGPPEGRFSREETVDGKTVAVVDSDILEHIDTKEWDNDKKEKAKKAAKNALLKFSDGVPVGGQLVKVNKISRDEYTRSNETERVYRTEKEVFADKMRAAAIADDIIIATTDWTRDGGLTHPRKDRFVDFLRGEVLIKAGENKYIATTVVGITDAGANVFYDVLDMEPTEFEITKGESPTAAKSETASSAIQEDSPIGRLSQEGKNVKGDFSQEENASYLQSLEELKRENEQLQERVGYWYKQAHLTDNTKPVNAAVTEKLAARLREQIGRGRMSKGEVARELQAFFELADQGKGKDSPAVALGIWEAALDLGRKMVSAAVEVDDDLAGPYRDIRRHIKNTQLIISPQDAADIADYGDVRKMLGRDVKLHVAKAGEVGNIDTAFKEMAGMWPDVFSEASVSTPSDQLLYIAEVLEQSKDIGVVNPYSAYLDEAAQWAGHLVMGAYEAARTGEWTVADRWKGKVERAQARVQEAVAEAVKQERARAGKRMEEFRKDIRERERAIRDRKADSEARNQLLKLSQRMERMKTNGANKALIRELIGNLDTAARTLSRDKEMGLWRLKWWVEDQKAKDSSFRPDPEMVKQIDRLDKDHVDNMSLQEVRELTRALQHIEHEIRTSKRLIEEADRRDIYQQGKEIIEGMRKVKGSRASGVGAFLDGFVTTEVLSPVRMVRRMVDWDTSSPLLKATEALDHGQKVMLDYQMRAEKPFEQFAKNEAFVKMFSGKHAAEVKIGGWDMETGKMVEVTVTPAMRASIYLHSLNEQNARHMAEGGVTVPDIKLYKKGKLAEAYARGTTVKIRVSDTQNLWRSMSETERAFVNQVQRYFRTVSQPELTHVAEALRGYAPEMLKDYYPITTNKNFMHQDIVFDAEGTATVLKPGYMEERVHSSSPMMLLDVDSVVERAIQQHGLFVGLAIPVRNFNKLWNVSTAGVDADGQYFSYAGSVKDAVSTTWGDKGQKYIEKMVKDVQGRQAQRDQWGGFLDKIRGNYAGAVLTLNGGVAIKQAASLPTAAAVLGWGPLSKAMKNFGQVNMDLIAKYTPYLWYRSKGYSNQELGDITSRKGHLPKYLNWIQGVDLLTTKKLWKASEYYVQEHNKALKVGTDPYYRAVAEIYDRVILETQPNYTTMERPQMLRSENALVKNMAMFKTQPMQNLNILYDAAGELRAVSRRYKAGEVSEAEVKAAWANFGRAATSQVAQAAVFAAMTAAWAWFWGKMGKYKDDEEDEVTLASFLKAYGYDAMSNLWSGIPFIPDAADYVVKTATGGKAYALDATSVSAIADTLQAFGNLGKLAGSLMGENPPSWKKTLRTAEGALEDISKVLGVPLENVVNLFNAVTRWGMVAVQGEYLGGYSSMKFTTDPERYSKDYYNLLYKALTKDQKAYQELYAQMVEDGWGPEKIKTAMEDRMKKTQGVKHVGDLEQRYVAPEKQEEYDKALQKLANAPLWNKVTEEQREAAKADVYEFTTRAGGEKAEEKRAKLEKAGVDSYEYAYAILARAFYDEPTENGNYKTYTSEEVMKAIEAVPGLSDTERRALWVAMGKKEDKSPW